MNAGLAVRDAAVKLDETITRQLDKWEEEYQREVKEAGEQYLQEKERMIAEKEIEKETREWEETWKREMKRREEFKRERDEAIKEKWKEEVKKFEKEFEGNYL